jgi:hypothetical protein
VLSNTSPNADALNVYIIVNFVVANGHLIGTASNTVPQVAARSEFNYGGSLSFAGAAPIDHLEIIIQIGGRQRGVVHPPSVDGVRAVPALSDAAWLGEVDGEVINESPKFRLVNTQLWAVVFDAGGNVLGGGSGSATAALPPGTRQAFAVLSGLDSVPSSRVAVARVSTVGTYTP